ncbi:MAG: glycosyltransferase family 2 protein [Chthoniobacteraceae bacterium]
MSTGELNQVDAAPELSLVIPCYNEGQVLPFLKERLLSSLKELGMSWEVILVDDGSHDDTLRQMRALHAEDPRFKVISFSRNFGHQTAVFAGMSRATGDFVALLDADLQDPPEFVATCVAKLKEGYDVVYAVRRGRKENILKRASYAMFYRLLKSISDVEIPLDAGDFCVMRQCVVSVLREMSERDVFVRGLRAWIGFRQVGIPYERGARAAGETKYPLFKLVKLAMDGVFAFSALPLHLAIYLGFTSVAVSLGGIVLLGCWKILNFRLFGQSPAEVPGWTSLACLILFLGGMQFLILGILGEFIRRMYDELRKRPRWIVRAEFGFSRKSSDD